MKQKYLPGQEVQICKDMPDFMSHFPADCKAIVRGTYSQMFGGNDIKSYSVLLLDENSDPLSSVSWYDESQLSLVSEDTIRGLELIESYNLA